MAYKFNPVRNIYAGLSTDTKPTNVLPGAILEEFTIATSALKTYKTYDGDNWIEVGDDVIGAVTLSGAIPSGSNTIGNVGIISATPLQVYEQLSTPFTFHSGTTGNGNVFSVGSYKSLTISITANAGTCTFYEVDSNGNATLAMGIKRSDWSSSTSTTTTGKWDFDVGRITTFYINASAAATITGKAGG